MHKRKIIRYTYIPGASNSTKDAAIKQSVVSGVANMSSRLDWERGRLNTKTRRFLLGFSPRDHKIYGGLTLSQPKIIFFEKRRRDVILS